MEDKRQFAFNVQVPVNLTVFGLPLANTQSVNLKTVDFTEEEARKIQALLLNLRQKAVQDFGAEAAGTLALPTPEDIAKLVAFFGKDVDGACELVKNAYTFLAEANNTLVKGE